MENENQDFIEAETSPSLRSNDINRTRNYKYRPQIKNQNTGIDIKEKLGNAAGNSMKVAGKSAELAGKGAQVLGKGAQAAGTGLSKAGAALSSTGLGAIAGVPLQALGGATKALGKGTELAGKGTEKLGKKNAINEIKKYIKKINGLDNESIINACKCVNYDVWFRNPMYALMYESETVIPDPYTINNIKIMIERSISFWKQYGPIEVSGFTFEEDGYTETVSSGDGDYLTKDTLWDFKVSKYDIKSNHTLQLLMYYIMGKHSKKEEYKTINKIGVFNPRLNKIYILETNKIPKDIIEAVEKDVICY